MANPKKNKLKKVTPRSPTPPAIANDDGDELMNDLLRQLDSQDETVQAESAEVLNEMNLNQQATQLDAQAHSEPKNKARNRFKARQARKAAALAQSYSSDDPAVQARLEKEAKDEEETINRLCKQLNVQVYEINPDGHCLYSAVADQLSLLGVIPPSDAKYATIRAAAANYIYSHPDDFLPFLVGPEDGINDGVMTPDQFETYCKGVRDTAAWGGEPEILALSRAFNVPVHVIQAGQPPIVVHKPSASSNASHMSDDMAVQISYHRKMYGLGEHYNSLRPSVKPR